MKNQTRRRINLIYVKLMMIVAFFPLLMPRLLYGAGDVSIVSINASNQKGNNASDWPAISADGRFIAFRSLASNLVSGDTNGTFDIFVFDRQLHTVERVSVDSAGTQADNQSIMPSLSGDGRYVAFYSYATNLVTGDVNGAADVFVHDRLTGMTERVSVSSNGDEPGGSKDSYAPSISGDGRYVAFTSDADNLVASDTNSFADIFVHDRQTGLTERVSVSSSGEQGQYFSQRPSISADGRFIAFESASSNFIVNQVDPIHTNIFVHDRQTGTTELVSTSITGGAGNNDSFVPSISADGRYVVFMSNASDLVPGDTNGVGDVFVRDRFLGTTERVSVSSTGQQGNKGFVYDPFNVSGTHFGSLSSISADGRYVVFESAASNLVANDGNLKSDVFIRDRQSGKTDFVSIAPPGAGTGGLGNGNSQAPSISADGRFVTFFSTADNFFLGDTVNTADVFVREIINTDTTPPTLSVPSNLVVTATSASGAVVTYVASATDDTDPNPTISCIPPSGIFFLIGTASVTCTATDASGNSANQSFSVSVRFSFGGFLPPLSANGVYQLGRTLPVKFDLTDANGALISNAVAHLSLQQLSGSNPVGDPVDASSSSAADSGNLFRFDGSHYIFNLDTRPLSAGTWQLRVALNDGSTHTLQIGLKAK